MECPIDNEKFYCAHLFELLQSGSGVSVSKKRKHTQLYIQFTVKKEELKKV